MEIRSHSAAQPFITTDGSTIRSLLDLSVAPVANHSLAEATLPAGGRTERHHHAAAGRVDEHRLRTHRVDPRPGDQPARLVGQRAVQAEDVGPAHQLVEVHQGDAERVLVSGGQRSRRGVADLHVEGPCPAHKGAPDRAEPDHAEPSAVGVLRGQR